VGLVSRFEDYDRRVDPYGVHLLTQRGSPKDQKVKAGDIGLEWSYGSLTNGWLYYDSWREKIEILDSASFESEL